MGLVGEAPTSYNINGYLQLLQTYGPLWITTSPNPGSPFSLHARILTGISGDGTPAGTTFKFMDPADGRLHSETFSQFVNEYEAWANQPNTPLILQIQHF